PAPPRQPPRGARPPPEPDEFIFVPAGAVQQQQGPVARGGWGRVIDVLKAQFGRRVHRGLPAEAGGGRQALVSGSGVSRGAISARCCSRNGGSDRPWPISSGASSDAKPAPSSVASS